jgi:hypothetical protein
MAALWPYFWMAGGTAIAGGTLEKFSKRLKKER